MNYLSWEDIVRNSEKPLVVVKDPDNAEKEKPPPQNIRT